MSGSGEGKLRKYWNDLSKEECVTKWHPIRKSFFEELDSNPFDDNSVGFRYGFRLDYGAHGWTKAGIGFDSTFERPFRGRFGWRFRGVQLGIDAASEISSFRWREDCCKCQQTTGTAVGNAQLQMRPGPLLFVLVPTWAVQRGIIGALGGARSAIPAAARALGATVMSW
jgi:hypothetical protein